MTYNFCVPLSRLNESHVSSLFIPGQRCAESQEAPDSSRDGNGDDVEAALRAAHGPLRQERKRQRKFNGKAGRNDRIDAGGRRAAPRRRDRFSSWRRRQSAQGGRQRQVGHRLRLGEDGELKLPHQLCSTSQREARTKLYTSRRLFSPPQAKSLCILAVRSPREFIQVLLSFPRANQWVLNLITRRTLTRAKKEDQEDTQCLSDRTEL